MASDSICLFCCLLMVAAVANIHAQADDETASQSSSSNVLKPRPRQSANRGGAASAFNNVQQTRWGNNQHQASKKFGAWPAAAAASSGPTTKLNNFQNKQPAAANRWPMTPMKVGNNKIQQQQRPSLQNELEPPAMSHRPVGQAWRKPPSASQQQQQQQKQQQPTMMMATNQHQQISGRKQLGQNEFPKKMHHQFDGFPTIDIKNGGGWTPAGQNAKFTPSKQNNKPTFPPAKQLPARIANYNKQQQQMVGKLPSSSSQHRPQLQQPHKFGTHKSPVLVGSGGGVKHLGGAQKVTSKWYPIRTTHAFKPVITTTTTIRTTTTSMRTTTTTTTMPKTQKDNLFLPQDWGYIQEVIEKDDSRDKTVEEFASEIAQVVSMTLNSRLDGHNHKAPAHPAPSSTKSPSHYFYSTATVKATPGKNRFAAYAPGEPYPPNSQFSCYGKTVIVSTEMLPWMACCGRTPYNVHLLRCEGGRLVGIDSWAPIGELVTAAPPLGIMTMSTASSTTSTTTTTTTTTTTPMTTTLTTAAALLDHLFFKAPSQWSDVAMLNNAVEEEPAPMLSNAQLDEMHRRFEQLRQSKLMRQSELIEEQQRQQFKSSPPEDFIEEAKSAEVDQSILEEMRRRQELAKQMQRHKSTSSLVNDLEPVGAAILEVAPYFNLSSLSLPSFEKFGGSFMLQCGNTIRTVEDSPMFYVCCGEQLTDYRQLTVCPEPISRPLVVGYYNSDKANSTIALETFGNNISNNNNNNNGVNSSPLPPVVNHHHQQQQQNDVVVSSSSTNINDDSATSLYIYDSVSGQAQKPNQLSSVVVRQDNHQPFRKRFERCGTGRSAFPYDPQAQFCCGGEIYQLAESGQICCDGVNYRYEKEATLGCCGSTAYDTKTHVCTGDYGLAVKY